MLHEMYLAETKADAIKAYKDFLSRYSARYPKACECLSKDEDVLFTFYDFPAEHWIHIRTTNPIESTFAHVRRRIRWMGAFKNAKSAINMTTMPILAHYTKW